jgi:hypothetical protein
MKTLIILSCLLYCIFHIIATLLIGFSNHNSLPFWTNILFLILLFIAMYMIQNNK